MAADSLLQKLVAVQTEVGHIDCTTISHIAEECCVPISEVRSLIDFYHFLNSDKKVRYHFYFSNNIIDKMAASDLLVADLARRLNRSIQQDPALVCIEETSCIGLSDQAPAALVNGRPLANLNPQAIEEIAELVLSHQPLNHWPDHLFAVQTRIHRRHWLLKMHLQPGDALGYCKTKGIDFVIQELQASQLRGRGGAGFNTASKWRSCQEQHSQQKYVVCNADEGEPGTFKDRILLTEYSDCLWEGMTLCGVTIGADQGVLYLRGEYQYLLPQLERSLQLRREAGWLGAALKKKLGVEFDIQIVLGAGAYICGEESALLESLEGKRGIPRIRPPFPTVAGYLGQPTVINNVETFINAAGIIAQGHDAFIQLGTTESRGTQLLSISGDCPQPGLYEYEFGVSLHKILQQCGAHQVQAVQIGGPSGQLIGPSSFHHTLGYDSLGGSGALMIFNHNRDLLKVVKNFTDFFAFESCGFCTPCRVGTELNCRALDRLQAGQGTDQDLTHMRQISALMQQASHCGLGKTASNPILHLLEHFPTTVGEALVSKEEYAKKRLAQVLQPATQLRNS